MQNLPQRQQIHLYLRRQFPAENNPDVRRQKQTARWRGICVGFRRHIKGKEYLGIDGDSFHRGLGDYILQKKRDGIYRLSCGFENIYLICSFIFCSPNFFTSEDNTTAIKIVVPSGHLEVHNNSDVLKPLRSSTKRLPMASML